MKSVVVWLIRLVIAGLLAPGSAIANFFFVDTTEDTVDSVPGDGLCADASANCTLRAAVMEANALAGADFIDLPAGIYLLSIPGNAEHAAATGDLDILDEVTIRGIDPTSTIIDAGGIDRAFELINAGAVAISRLTIQNGVAGRNTPGYFVDFAGGGIFNVGNTSSVTLTEVEIRNNSARTGGGLFNIFSTMEIHKTAVYDNAATAGAGGGVAEGIAGYVRIYNSTISGNSATLGGGGMSTSNNAAILNNVTITNNVADSDDNGTGDGGGISQGITGPVLGNSILAGNVDRGGEAPDCGGGITSSGYNLMGDNSGCAVSASTGDQIGTAISPLNPWLAPLADNGGPTLTHALLNGSLALDGGNPASPGGGGGACERTDQRGTLRTTFAPCDMGALESTPSAGISFTVNSTLDHVDAVIGDGACETVPGNTICTLRAAIQETNALIGSDRIEVPAGAYVLGIPGDNEDFAATGDLDISDGLALNGSGSTTTIIDADFLDRIFQTRGNANVTLSGLTIQNGVAALGDGGGIYHQSAGVLTVNDSKITANSASSGGGIFTVGFNHVTLNRSVLSNNTATTYGGGIANFTFSTSTISDSTISGNKAATGGGLMNSFLSYAIIRNSTISDNRAQFGGGIGTLWGDGIITLTNSTLSGNRASAGGGGINVSTNDTINLRNTTITANQAGILADGGGINNSGLVNLRNTIIAGNRDEGGEAPDCMGILSSQGNNILGDDSSCSLAATADDIVGNSISPVDPLLAPLSHNGGHTLTHALLAGSPAFNAGNIRVPGSGGSACEPDDQRGTDRAINAPCDIGAVETVIADVGVTITGDVSPLLPGGAIRYLVEITNAGPDTATNLLATYLIPDGAKLVATSGSAWSCGSSGSVLSCTSPDLSSGTTTSLNVDLLAPVTSGSFTSSVFVAADTLDLDTANNTATEFTGVNAAPVFNTTSSPTYTQGDPPMIIAEDALISDADDSHLESAAILISSGYMAGQDELRFNDTASITGYWDSVTGQMTLSGSDTVAAYQAALRSIQYFNADPAALPGSRSFTYQVSDGDVSSTVVSNMLTVIEAVQEPSAPPPLDAVIAPEPAPIVETLAGEPSEEALETSRIRFGNTSSVATESTTPNVPDDETPDTTETDIPNESISDQAENAPPQQTPQPQNTPTRTAPIQTVPSTASRVAARSADMRSRTTPRAASDEENSRKRALDHQQELPDKPAGNDEVAMVNLALFTQLDSMGQQMHRANQEEKAKEEIIVGTAKSVTVVLFAGVVNWYLKAGSMLASLLSSAPLWAPFDPLPILSLNRQERKRRRSEDEKSKLEEDQKQHRLGELLDTERSENAFPTNRSAGS